MKVKPIGDRVLVKPAKEEETKKGGIIIPDSAKEKPQEGKVIAVGTGKTDENGKKIGGLTTELGIRGRIDGEAKFHGKETYSKRKDRLTTERVC